MFILLLFLSHKWTDNFIFLEKLSLNIPWSSIYTNPVVINIEDVYVLVGPQSGIVQNSVMRENVFYVRCTALANDDSINILFYDEIITWFKVILEITDHGVIFIYRLSLIVMYKIEETGHIAIIMTLTHYSPVLLF